MLKRVFHANKGRWFLSDSWSHPYSDLQFFFEMKPTPWGPRGFKMRIFLPAGWSLRNIVNFLAFYHLIKSMCPKICGNWVLLIYLKIPTSLLEDYNLDFAILLLICDVIDYFIVLLDLWFNWLRRLWNPKLLLRLGRNGCWFDEIEWDTGTCKVHSYDLIYN